MTEEQWLNGHEPTPMLVFLKGVSSDRKLRLFAVASCRESATLRCRESWAWRLFPNDQCREAINLAEQFADGAIGWKQLWEAREAISVTRAANRSKHSAGYSWPKGDAWATVAIEVAAIPVIVPQFPGTCGFIRDIFNNPFRPVALDPSWHSSTAVAIAQAIYDDRAFDRLPILADALQDAGCENADILSHCRSDGPHVRGCWVVDLVLGKQ